MLSSVCISCRGSSKRARYVFTSVSTDYTVGCKGDSVEYEVSRDPDGTGFNYIILKDRVPDVIKESFDK